MNRAAGGMQPRLVGSPRDAPVFGSAKRVRDASGGPPVGISEGAPTWTRHAIRAPSVSERVVWCDAGIGETPRLRLGL